MGRAARKSAVPMEGFPRPARCAGSRGRPPRSTARRRCRVHRTARRLGVTYGRDDAQCYLRHALLHLRRRIPSESTTATLTKAQTDRLGQIGPTVGPLPPRTGPTTAARRSRLPSHHVRIYSKLRGDSLRARKRARSHGLPVPKNLGDMLYTCPQCGLNRRHR